ncbi:histidine kinase [Streptomyces sp. ID05-04B]|uniref:sensor histidine kinase n=1 Tax=Streptomyces sp. ID05-04B TaxID=3028661 RepID=UPI0029C2D715|nr:histidine kinase [Streptomyces sp. ID05-04B]MDX5564986.1 histidine kinase [Streptomyces sp. ID05-04B]
MIAWARRHARALDVTFVGAFAVALMLPLPQRPAAWQESSQLWHLVMAALLSGPLLFRWRRPRLVFGVLVLATLATWAPAGGYVGHIALPIAGYAMAVSVERPVAIRATATALPALLLPLLWTVPPGSAGAVAEAEAWTALGCVLGMATASQRRYFREARERVRAAEQSREEEAARRVAEERLRISRELHDVIAHHVAVINVQTGVAEHLLRTDPDTAENALRTARGSAQTVLSELGGVLAVLRQHPGAEGLRAPAPGVDRIPDLVATTSGQGHAVSLDVEGKAQDTPDGIGLTAYRVVQEALTNVHKHAPSADARVRLRWEPHELTVSVTNEPTTSPTTPPAADSGFGLIGMRERVVATGGVLVAEPLPDGGFLVRAHLPLKGRTS